MVHEVSFIGWNFSCGASTVSTGADKMWWCGVFRTGSSFWLGVSLGWSQEQAHVQLISWCCFSGAFCSFLHPAAVWGTCPASCQLTAAGTLVRRRAAPQTALKIEVLAQGRSLFNKMISSSSKQNPNRACDMNDILWRSTSWEHRLNTASALAAGCVLGAEPPPRALNPNKKGGSEGHSGCNEGKKAREKTTLASALWCFLLTWDVLSSSAEQNINNLWCW